MCGKSACTVRRGGGAETNQHFLPIASTVLSKLAEARREPSGLNPAPLTSLVCPLSVKHSWPVAASQTCTVWFEAPRRVACRRG